MVMKGIFENTWQEIEYYLDTFQATNETHVKCMIKVTKTNFLSCGNIFKNHMSVTSIVFV